MFVLHIVAALLWAGCSTAQAWKNQVNLSMCNWGQLRANAIRDTVYLDGGRLWWQEGYSDHSVQYSNDDNKQGRLYSLNLSSSFDRHSNLTALFGTLSKAGGIANNLAPNYRDGVMFANDNELYLYGGLLRLTNSQDEPAGDRVLGYERYQYGGYRSNWESGFVEDKLDNGVTRYLTNGAGVSAPSENLGFYISGMRAPDWGPIADDQSANQSSHRMIQVDLSTMRENQWSNRSLPDEVPARANAELVWLPVSQSGVLVAIGGVPYPEEIFRTDGLNRNQQTANQRDGPSFMQTVSVYDVAQDRWYLQNTTGDMPPALTQFCSVYASAADGSSHNIYIYGGYDGLKTDSAPSDDVYVLSVPSFEWIKLYSGEKRHGRRGHRCVKPYPDKMLVLGGVYRTASDCLDGGIVQVFNLNTGQFQDEYDPEKWSDYKVPDLVSGRIGGGAQGDADQRAPKSWTNSSLKDVFASKYTKTISSWYPYNRTDNGSTPTVSAVPDKKPSFPGWAGAIIGVVLGLLLVGGAVAFWCFHRRRHLRRGSQMTSEGKRSHIMRWMYAGSPGIEDGPKSTGTTASVSYQTQHPNDSAVDQSVATATSPRTIEAGSDPIYEMHDQSTTPPVELPTPFNNPSPSPTASDASSYGFVSPLSNTPARELDSAPTRLAHHRQVSSLSSTRSFSIANMIQEEGPRHSRRPRQVSDVSEASFSSEGTRLGETSSRLSTMGEDETDTREGSQ